MPHTQVVRQSTSAKRLAKQEFEIQKLKREHEKLEQRLRTLNQKKFLSPAEELEKRDLQKRKLLGRDRMEEILRAN